MKVSRLVWWTLAITVVVSLGLAAQSSDPPPLKKNPSVKVKSATGKLRSTDLTVGNFPLFELNNKEQGTGWPVLTGAAKSSWEPAPPVIPLKPLIVASAQLQPPVVSLVPPFPYALIGRIESDGKVLALLSSSDGGRAVAVGQVIDGKWKVEELNDRGLVLVWLADNQIKNVNYAQ